MRNLSEAQIQLLIALAELSEEVQPANSANLNRMKDYFRRSLVDWTDAFPSLITDGYVSDGPGDYRLTDSGRRLAAQLHKARPRMWYWYTDYYMATKDSKAYAEFCRRVFGRNFAQHGFSDMAQLSKLLEVANLGPGNRVLDLGCGNGSMAEYISAVTGAHVTGIDYIPEAIRQAQERTGAKPRLSFQVMNMDNLSFPPASFDTLMSIDTLYFVDAEAAIGQMKTMLVPGGQMVIFFAHGADGPAADRETFPKETLPPDKTPLGEALIHHGLRFRTWDFTQADYEHARLKKQVIEELCADLEAEGNLFLYENRHAEAVGVMAAVEAGVQARYLYHVLA